MKTKYNSLTEDYLKEIIELTDKDSFEFYFLICSISQILGKSESFHYSIWIAENQDSWLLLQKSRDIHFYGQNWSDNQLNSIQEEIQEIKKSQGIHLVGTTELVKETVIRYNIKNELFKERMYFICYFTIPERLTRIQEIRVCNSQETDEVCQMVIDFFKEEYNGANNKTFEEVKSTISVSNTWILKHENEIKSICTTMLSDSFPPIIGSFYTKTKDRKKGYGSSLIRHVTTVLLEEHNEVALFADKSNAESVSLFEKIGFSCIYETIDLIIK